MGLRGGGNGGGEEEEEGRVARIGAKYGWRLRLG